jgi:hypothetical protein
MRRMHHNEGAGRRIDHQVAWLGSCSNQPRGKIGGLGMWMNGATDLLLPPVRNAVVAPRSLIRVPWLLDRGHDPVGQPVELVNAALLFAGTDLVQRLLSNLMKLVAQQRSDGGTGVSKSHWMTNEPIPQGAADYL